VPEADGAISVALADAELDGLPAYPAHAASSMAIEASVRRLRRIGVLAETMGGNRRQMIAGSVTGTG
jgi:hypothetical protein